MSSRPDRRVEGLAWWLQFPRLEYNQPENPHSKLATLIAFVSLSQVKPKPDIDVGSHCPAFRTGSQGTAVLPPPDYPPQPTQGGNSDGADWSAVRDELPVLEPGLEVVFLKFNTQRTSAVDFDILILSVAVIQ